MTAIKVPPNKTHTPAAQAIAGLQKDLKRYNKQEEKTPAAWRRIKIQELEERCEVQPTPKAGWLTPTPSCEPAPRARARNALLTLNLARPDRYTRQDRRRAA